MDPLTFEAVTRNPALIEALLAQAHRERAEAMHRLLILPIKRLLSRPAARPHLGHPRKAGGAPA